MLFISVRYLILFVFLALIASTGCRSANDVPATKLGNAAQSPDPSKPSPAAAPVADQRKEPDFITVQHILIGFQGSVPGKPITRTKEEAEALAKELFAKASSGETDFAELVRENTDDAFPGVYAMANHGVAESSIPQGTFPRGGMVAAFGDVGFPLEVGQVGLAPYDPAKSKYGWHIIKRVK